MGLQLPRDTQRWRQSSVPGVGPVIILTDWQFWTQHQAELDAWCLEHGAQRTGMTVDMPDDVLILFALRWS
jgi:hypothetical protein